METSKAYVTCTCNVCSGPIPFDAVNIGATVQCPHCRRDTVLFLPSQFKVQAKRGFFRSARSFVVGSGKFVMGLIYLIAIFYLLNFFLGGCTHHAINAVGEKVIKWTE